MAQALADAGLEYKIEEASDADEAARYVSRKWSENAVPRLIILDMTLPKRSGLELMTEWHAMGLTKLTRIIVLSSVLPEGQVAKLQELGALRVFEKPPELPEFLNLGKRVKELAG